MKVLPSRNEHIPVEGLSLSVTVSGDGPPVILLHGFPENGHSWRHQVPPLVAAGFSAWVVNLRGYPPSDISKQRQAYHLRHLVNDVAAVVAHTGYPRASVVGHDWGGIIAWTFAAMYPARLHRLVVMNAPHMQIYADKVWRSSQCLRSLYAGFFQIPVLPECLLAAGNFAIVRSMFRHLPIRRGAFGEDDINHYIEPLSQSGALKAALDYYRANMTTNGMALARSACTDAAVLVIWGERDPALGTVLLEGLERFAPLVQICRIPDAGHWIQNEAPVEVNQALLKFLTPAPRWPVKFPHFWSLQIPPP